MKTTGSRREEDLHRAGWGISESLIWPLLSNLEKGLCDVRVQMRRDSRLGNNNDSALVPRRLSVDLATLTGANFPQTLSQ